MDLKKVEQRHGEETESQPARRRELRVSPIRRDRVITLAGTLSQYRLHLVQHARLGHKHHRCPTSKELLRVEEAPAAELTGGTGDLVDQCLPTEATVVRRVTG